MPPTPTPCVPPPLEVPSGHPLVRALRAVLIERRLPYRVERSKEHLLRAVGLATKFVRVDGMRIRIRRQTIDENFVANILVGREYDPPGYEVRPGDVVLDIGANIGCFALKAARTARIVYAVEPSGANFALLEENVRRNATGRVEILRGAVADHPGTVRLLRGREGGYDTIIPSRAGRVGDPRPPEEVPAYTLAGLFERFGIARCDVLKMDCEGAEHQAVCSLPDGYWGRIGRIVMEYHGIGANREEDRAMAAELAALIERHGFRLDTFEEFAPPFRGGHIRATNCGSGWPRCDGPAQA